RLLCHRKPAGRVPHIQVRQGPRGHAGTHAVDIVDTQRTAGDRAGHGTGVRSVHQALGTVADTRHLRARFVTHLSMLVRELGLVLFPSLLWDAGWVELAFVADNDLLSLFARDNARVAPGEVVHMPEGIQRKTE